MDRADTVADEALEAVHAQLLRVLAALDAAAAHGAAAHVAAALDLVEARRVPGERERAGAVGPVAAMARAMVEQFGPRASAVARRQLDEASGPAFLSWAAIISRMDG